MSLRRVALVAAVAACAGSRPPDPTSPLPGPPGPGVPASRSAAVPREHPLFPRVEGTGLRNDCRSDPDCRRGGCSGEVCSAEAQVVTTCEAQAWPQGDAACGCLDGECRWYLRAIDPVVAPPAPAQGQPCADGRCPDGLRCLSYYGIAGAAGPLFTSCEIPCAGRPADCPPGQACVTIADGPGAVCRPR